MAEFDKAISLLEKEIEVYPGERETQSLKVFQDWKKSLIKARRTKKFAKFLSSLPFFAKSGN